MARVAGTKKDHKGAAVRRGRPPQELAAKVDERILDAARRLFLQHGLSGTSVEDIARLAHAGKGTIYARFPTKEALFAAIATRNATHVRAGFESEAPAGATIEERLVNLAINLLERLLVDDVIDFIRLAVGEVRRFPELASVGRMARDRGAHAVAAVLGEIARTDEIENFPAFAPERVAKTTLFFLDLVVEPVMKRAVYGENLKSVRGQIPSSVPEAVAFFLTACQKGGAD